MTQETKWTRGPWQKNYGRRHSPDECDIEIVGDIFVLANINGPNYAHCEANARLIAAAPEMAEALRPFAALLEIFEQNAGNRPKEGEICSWIDHRVGERTLTVEQLVAARAALKKAGGLT